MGNYHKLILFSLLIIANFNIGYSQVGINTVDPQQELHVAGATSTIRIDGLNETNNANNIPAKDVPVHIDNNGDLKIPSLPAGGELLINENDIIVGSTRQVDTEVDGSIHAESIYSTASFTLTQRAIVMVSYSISFSVRKNNATNDIIHDGKARLIENYIRLQEFSGGSWSNINSNTAFSSTAYSNYTEPMGSGKSIAGFFVNNASDFMILDPGTYRFRLIGLVTAGPASSGTPLPPNSNAFRATFGGLSTDIFKVVAIY